MNLNEFVAAILLATDEVAGKSSSNSLILDVSSKEPRKLQTATTAAKRSSSATTIYLVFAEPEERRPQTTDETELANAHAAARTSAQPYDDS